MANLLRFCLICMVGETSLNQHLLKAPASLSARFCRSGSQGLGMGSAGRKVWVPRGGMLLPGEITMFSIQWALRLPFGLPNSSCFLGNVLSLFSSQSKVSKFFTFGYNFKYCYQHSNVCGCLRGQA